MNDPKTSSFRERVEKIASKPSYRKAAYERRVGAAYSALFCFLFVPSFFIAETFFGFSSYFLSGVAAVALVLGMYVGKAKADKKFRNTTTKIGANACR